MKKLIILTCLLIFICVHTLANNNQMKLLASYPSQGVYFYYMPNFNIDTFKRPPKIQPVDSRYVIFIYDKDISAKNFAYRNKIKIEDNPGYLYEMILIGIDNGPTHYINRTINQNSEAEVNVCKLKKDNWQTKYMLNPKTNKFEKQIIFNNGKLGVTSICNSNYVPFQDI